MTTMIYLVRHAEQDRTPDEHPSVGLSAIGREQARLLGRRLRAVPLAGIHHGPAARAQETAQGVAAQIPGVPVQVSELLADRTPTPAAGTWAGYSPGELAWLDGVPPAERDPGGAAITAAIKHFSSLGEGHHLLISHAFVVGWFVRSALAAPVRAWLGLNPFNAALTVIRYRPDHPDLPAALISYNDLGHLPLEVRGASPVDLSS